MVSLGLDWSCEFVKGRTQRWLPTKGSDYPHDATVYSLAPPLKPTQTAAPTGDYIVKHPSLWDPAILPITRIQQTQPHARGERRPLPLPP